MNPEIIYEDEFILGLTKPSGLMVHSDGRSNDRTLVDWIRENYPALEDVGEDQTLQNGEVVKRPGIVHRLDRETSGVILVAKTKEAFAFLKEQFQNRKVKKIYHALVWGRFKDDKKEGVVDLSIGRSAADFRRWSAEHGAKGELREAVTEYKVLWQDDSFSYLEVRPRTGRTHQIRVHMKAISHAIVCDKLYGGSHPCSKETCLGFDRLALHAKSINLELPNGIYINIESPLPEEFEENFNLLSKERAI